MKARRSAKVAFIASVIAATPVTTALPAFSSALTGTCSTTGSGGTSNVLTLSGSGSSDTDITGTATSFSYQAVQTITSTGTAEGIGVPPGDPIVLDASVSGKTAGSGSTSSLVVANGTQSMSSWSQAWSGSDTNLKLNTCGHHGQWWLDNLYGSADGVTQSQS